MRSNEHSEFRRMVKQCANEPEDVQWLHADEMDNPSQTESPEIAPDTFPPRTLFEQQERRITQLEAFMRQARMPRRRDMPDPLISHKDHQLCMERGFNPDEHERVRFGRGRTRRITQSRIMWRHIVLAGAAASALGTAGAIILHHAIRSGVFEAAGVHGDELSVAAITEQASAAASAHGGQDAPEVKPQAVNPRAKPIATASLNVADVAGDVNRLIPLNISATLAYSGQDIALRVNGLPNDAYLTAGTKLADNAWMLRRGEETGVKLKMPPVQTSQLLIEVEAIDLRTGDFAAPPEEMKVTLDGRSLNGTAGIEPTSETHANVTRDPASEGEQQAAAAQPVPRPLEDASGGSTVDSESMLRNGKKLLDLGDFTTARAFFGKARDLGNVEASFLLGRSFDPIFFRDRNVIGMESDPAIARKYYLEAKSAGVTVADDALAELDTWLKQ